MTREKQSLRLEPQAGGTKHSIQAQMTGLIIPGLLQWTMDFWGILDKVGLGVSLSQHGVTQVWTALPLSEAFWGLLCVWNTQETRATKKAQDTPVQE